MEKVLPDVVTESPPPPPPPPAVDAAPAPPAAKKDKRRAQWKRRRDRAAKLGDAAEVAAEHLDWSMDPISHTQEGAAETPAKEAQKASSVATTRELHLREKLEAAGEDRASPLSPSLESSSPIGIESSPPTPRGHARSGDVIALSRTSSSRGGFGESDGDASSGHFVWADVEQEQEEAEQETVGRRAAVSRTQDALAAAANHSGGGAAPTKRASRRQRKAAAAAAAAAEVKAAAATEAAAAVEAAAETVRQQEEEAARDVAVERPSPLEPCAPLAAPPEEPSSCVMRVASSGRYDDAGAGAALLALLQAGPREEALEAEAGADYVVQRSQSAYAASVDSASLQRDEVTTGGFDAEAARRFLAERTSRAPHPMTCPSRCEQPS